jgi:hypothetical protein
MITRHAIFLSLCVLLASGLARAAEPPSMEANARSWRRSDLPTVQVVVREALGRLPRTFDERKDWLQRMRRAAWLPQIQVQYLVSDDFVDDLAVFERTVVQTETGGDEATHGGSQTEVVFGDPAASTTATETRRVDREPSVTARGTTRITREEGLDSVQTGSTRRSTDEWGVLLTWNLSAFVFQPDEVRAADANARIERFRLEFVDAIVNFYYDLVEAMAFLDADPENVRMAIQVERNLSKLDVLTGGYVSRYMADTREARQEEAATEPPPEGEATREP